MKLFITLCLILFAEIKCKNVYRFDYTYYPPLKASLKVHVIPDIWPSANERCIAEGATMAWPYDDNIFNTMTATLRTHNIQKAFIGVHSIYSHGDYTSVDGTPISRQNLRWETGEPDFAGGTENCLVLTSETTVADVNCSHPYPYLCYKKHDINIQKTKCGTVDPEYTYNKKTNSCYKLHSRVRNWNGAYKICYAEGAHLVIINDDVEAKEVQQMMKNGVKYDKSGCRDFTEVMDNFYAGLYNWEAFGWHTIYGDTSYYTGKTRCDKFTALPSPLDLCGSLDMESVAIGDTECHFKLPFICEKSPESLLVNTGAF